jgi:hypothetical protein
MYADKEKLIKKYMDEVIDMWKIESIRFSNEPTKSVTTDIANTIFDNSTVWISNITFQDRKKYITPPHKDILKLVNKIDRHTFGGKYEPMHDIVERSKKDTPIYKSTPRVTFLSRSSLLKYKDSLNTEMIVLLSSRYHPRHQVPAIENYVIDHATFTLHYKNELLHAILGTYCDGTPMLFDSNQDHGCKADWTAKDLDYDMNFRNYVTYKHNYQTYGVDYIVYVRKDIFDAAPKVDCKKKTVDLRYHKTHDGSAPLSPSKFSSLRKLSLSPASAKYYTAPAVTPIASQSNNSSASASTYWYSASASKSRSVPSRSVPSRSVSSRKKANLRALDWMSSKST